MKIKITCTTSKLYHTLNDLLKALHLEDYSIAGDSVIGYNETKDISLYNESKHITLHVSRDDYGAYSTELNDSKIRYYVVDKFHRVIRLFKSTDNISASMLKQIRYKEYKYMEYHHNPVPCKIYMIYDSKLKVGDTVRENPMEYINWAYCKQAYNTRERD